MVENKDENRFGRIRVDEDGPVNFTSGAWLFPGFGNTGVVETSEGLVLIDLPVASQARALMEQVRGAVPGPVSTVFLTHGHLDHGSALDPLFENADQGPPRIVAQRNLVKRLNKYRMLDGYHEYINRVQFGVPDGVKAFPTPKHNPDTIFDQSLSLSVGGLDFHAFHALGETDDALWLWVPEKKTVFAGDLVVWSFPNVGNPFKVQRYTLEWAEGLEAIIAREPEFLVPGHGPLLAGRDNIRQTLLKISRALRYLHREVVDRLNKGMWYEDILHDVTLPEEMLDNEFLAPRYGCPTFVVHGILRQYTGWYDGNPSNLFPPKKNDIFKEICKLTEPNRLMNRARELAGDGNAAMALQLVDMAMAGDLSAEDMRNAHLFKAEILEQMARKEKSFIAANIYWQGHRQEKKAAGD